MARERSDAEVNYGGMKKTILILVGHYLPGIKAGGPVRTIASLVEGVKG
jgi:hypothetical protein